MKGSVLKPYGSRSCGVPKGGQPWTPPRCGQGWVRTPKIASMVRPCLEMFWKDPIQKNRTEQTKCTMDLEHTMERFHGKILRTLMGRIRKALLQHREFYF